MLNYRQKTFTRTILLGLSLLVISPTQANQSMVRTALKTAPGMLASAGKAALATAKQHPWLVAGTAITTFAQVSIFKHVKKNKRASENSIKMLEKELASLPQEEAKQADEKSNAEIKIAAELTVHLPNGQEETITGDHQDPYTTEMLRDQIKQDAKKGDLTIIARVQAANPAGRPFYFNAHEFNVDFFDRTPYPINPTRHDYYRRFKIPESRSLLQSDGAIQYFIYDHQHPERGFQHLCSYSRLLGVYIFSNGQQGSPFLRYSEKDFLNIFHAHQPQTNISKFEAQALIYDNANSYFYRPNRPKSRALVEVTLRAEKARQSALQQYTFKEHIFQKYRARSTEGLVIRSAIGSLVLSSAVVFGAEGIRFLGIMDSLHSISAWLPHYTLTFAPTQAGSTLPTLISVGRPTQAQRISFAWAQLATKQQIINRILLGTAFGTYFLTLAPVLDWVKQQREQAQAAANKVLHDYEQAQFQQEGADQEQDADGADPEVAALAALAQARGGLQAQLPAEDAHEDEDPGQLPQQLNPRAAAAAAALARARGRLQQARRDVELDPEVADDAAADPELQGFYPFRRRTR